MCMSLFLSSAAEGQAVLLLSGKNVLLLQTFTKTTKSITVFKSNDTY